MDIEFRRFIPEDKETFLVMVKKFYAPPAVIHIPNDDVFISNFIEASKNNTNIYGYILTADEKAAGYAIVSLKYETEVGGYAAWIEELFVENEFRGNGIGTKFFEFIKDEFSNSVRRLRLEVGEDNISAMKLYKNLGFDFLGYRQMIIDF